MTPKAERFVEEYLVDQNATQAAIRAGYAASSAENTGYKLLKRPDVADAIAAKRAKVSERTGLTVEYLDQKLKTLLDFDPRRLLNDDGSLKPASEWDDATAAAVAGLEIEELFDGYGKDREHIGTARKVKIADRIKPIELGLRRVGALRDTSISVGQLNLIIQD